MSRQKLDILTKTRDNYFMGISEAPPGPKPIARFHPRHHQGNVNRMGRRDFFRAAAGGALVGIAAEGAILAGSYRRKIGRTAIDAVTAGVNAIREAIDPAAMLYGEPIQFDPSQEAPRTNEQGHVLLAKPPYRQDVLKLDLNIYDPSHTPVLTLRRGRPTLSAEEVEFTSAGTISTGHNPPPLATGAHFGTAVAGESVAPKAQTFKTLAPSSETEATFSVWFLQTDRKGHPVNPRTNRQEFYEDGQEVRYYISGLQVRRTELAK